MADDSNPAFLQFITIGRDIGQVIRDESHVVSEPVKNIQDLKHPQ